MISNTTFNFQTTSSSDNMTAFNNDIGKAYIQEAFRKTGILLNEVQIDQFLLYFKMLIDKNKVMNLTAITEFEDVVEKHFIDSVLVWKCILKSDSVVLTDEQNKKMNGSLIDIGSGAGFPGIPLKIVFPGLRVVLLDSLNKRVSFLNEVISALHLSDISAIHARAEDAAFEAAYREKFDFCVSRAVANLSSLSEYCLPFVRRGGRFIAYKSSDIENECLDAKKAIFLLGGVTESVSKARIPDTDIERTFVVIRKERGTPVKYPRKAGVPTKSPLK